MQIDGLGKVIVKPFEKAYDFSPSHCGWPFKGSSRVIDRAASTITARRSKSIGAVKNHADVYYRQLLSIDWHQWE